MQDGFGISNYLSIGSEPQSRDAVLETARVRPSPGTRARAQQRIRSRIVAPADPVARAILETILSPGPDLRSADQRFRDRLLESATAGAYLPSGVPKTTPAGTLRAEGEAVGIDVERLFPVVGEPRAA